MALKDGPNKMKKQKEIRFKVASHVFLLTKPPPDDAGNTTHTIADKTTGVTETLHEAQHEGLLGQTPWIECLFKKEPFKDEHDRSRVNGTNENFRSKT